MGWARTAAILGLAMALGAVLASLFDGHTALRLVPRTTAGRDPLGYSAGKAAPFEQAAAQGLSQALYEKSPGGVVAAAARTASYRSLIDRATKGTDIDPAIVEAIVMLESAGLPNAIAGSDPANAAGLTQILAQTGIDFLGMKIDLAKSRVLTARIDTAEANGDTKALAKLLAERRLIDARFDPAQAIAGTVRYLTTAESTFGRGDLAVVSYHMGIGNLENVIRDYAGAGTSQSIATVVSQNGLTWPQLFFASSPVSHAQAWGLLAGFGDDSKTYYWRVLAAAEIMRLYRTDPEQLEALANLHTSEADAEDVLHPESSTPQFSTPAALARGLSAGTLQPLPDDPAAFFLRIDPGLGGFAGQVGAQPALYRALTPEALALLVYLAAQVHAIGGSATPLTVASAVIDESYRQLLPSAADAYSPATTGFEFDLLRRYGSFGQARALQYELDRLQALDLVAWNADGSVLHITVSSAARELVPVVLKQS